METTKISPSSKRLQVLAQKVSGGAVSTVKVLFSNGKAASGTVILLFFFFVAISLLGCKFGEIVGKFIYDSSTEAKKKKLIAENFNSGNKNNNVNLNA